MKNAVPSQRFKSLCGITDHSKNQTHKHSTDLTVFQYHGGPVYDSLELEKRLKGEESELGRVKPQ